MFSFSATVRFLSAARISNSLTSVPELVRAKATAPDVAVEVETAQASSEIVTVTCEPVGEAFCTQPVRPRAAAVAIATMASGRAGARRVGMGLLGKGQARAGLEAVAGRGGGQRFGVDTGRRSTGCLLGESDPKEQRQHDRRVGQPADDLQPAW